MTAIDPVSGRRMARPGVSLIDARRESLVLAIISIMMMDCEQNRGIRTSGVPVPQIVAHRGASHDAPENTLAAFRLGFEQGADAIEGDFRVTRDGVIIAMHDADFRRTTGDPRRVEDVDFEDVQQLDAGSWGRWAGGAFAGERVPRLEEVLAIVPEARVLFIEVKGTRTMVPALIETIASRASCALASSRSSAPPFSSASNSLSSAPATLIHHSCSERRPLGPRPAVVTG